MVRAAIPPPRLMHAGLQAIEAKAQPSGATTAAGSAKSLGAKVKAMDGTAALLVTDPGISGAAAGGPAAGGAGWTPASDRFCDVGHGDGGIQNGSFERGRRGGSKWLTWETMSKQRCRAVKPR